MVNVPVKDHHSLALVDGVLCSDCHIVKEAEAMDNVTVCMMPRWSYDTVSTIILTFLLLIALF